MLIPSIDLQNGHAVQLIGGKDLELDAGPPWTLAQRFRIAGEIAVIDLDAALGQGSNQLTIERLITMARCRVGGGIRSVDAALNWLDKGASRIILGTAARPEILRELPRERVIAALDAVDGEVVVDGWRTKTGASIIDRMHELRAHVGGFLVTFVEREGRMQGTDMGRVRALVKAAGDAKLTIAGGVTTTQEIAQLDALGADAQVGMALYKGHMDFLEATLAPMLHQEGKESWPAVIVDEFDVALALKDLDLATLRALLHEDTSHPLWRGPLRSIELDEMRRTMRVRMHASTSGDSEWSPERGLPKLARMLRARANNAPQGSYTQRLFEDETLLRSKLLEEVHELMDAHDIDEARWETADVLYFTLVAMQRCGVDLHHVAHELDRRALRVRRRKGDAKNHTPK